jgi:hypothetical protein
MIGRFCHPTQLQAECSHPDRQSGEIVPDDELQQAASCRRQHNAAGISKFNPKPSAPADRCSADLFERCRALIAIVATRE